MSSTAALPIPAVAVVARAGASHQGSVRTRNEDALLVGTDRFAVADGVGGAPGGDIAAALVVQSLRRLPPAAPAGPALAAAQGAIARRAVREPALTRMGTTVVTALVREGHVEIANVGDSRAYRLRDDHLEQLTEDHGMGNILTRWLGAGRDAVPDVQRLDAHPGDVYLLCSDGLPAMLEDAAIAHILRTTPTLQGAADRLVRLANARGGFDNVTVALFALGAHDGRAAA